MKNLDRIKVLIEQIIIQHHNVQKEQEELINLKKKLIADLLSDDFKSSSTIKTPLGIVRIAKNKKKYFYSLLSKEFNKLDYSLKKDFFKKKLTQIIFKINQNVYEDFLQNKNIPAVLKNLVVQKEKNPFSISVLKKNNDEIENKIYEKYQDLEYEVNDDDIDNDNEYEEIEFDSAFFSDDEDLSDTYNN
jgi:hypothetical protein